MPLNAGRHRGSRHLGALDGLRGLAALAVVVTHVGFESGASFRGDLGALAARADIGVAIFFVLSGFLLYRPFATAHATAGEPPRVGRYLWHRLLRIYPAYLVVLAVVLVVHHRDDLTAWTVSGNLFLLQTYDVDLLLPELAQSWTLSTELAWYLALPVVGLVVLRRPAGRSAERHLAVQLGLCALFVVGSVAFAGAVRAGTIFDPFVAGYWLPHYLGWFALGMTLALLYVGAPSRPRPGWLTELGNAPVSCFALAAVLYGIACTPVAGPRGLTGLTPWEGFAREALYGSVALLLVLPAAVGDPARSLSVAGLGSWPARYLGDISYALYLWHFPLLPLAFWLTGTAEFGGRFWLNLVVLLGIALPVAALSWHLVERPALRAKSWSPGQRRRDPAPNRRYGTSAEATTETTASAAHS